MAYRGSRGGSRGGRGEALMKLLQKTAVSPEEEECPPDIGVQGSSSQGTKPMGRSAALMKLLESASGAVSPSVSEQPSYIQKKESVMSRGTTRSSFSETTVTAGPSRESYPSRGIRSSISETSTRELEQQYAPRGRMRYDPTLSEKEIASARSRQAPFADEGSLEESLSELTVSDTSNKPAVIKKGSYGQEVTVSANYIRLKVEEGMGVFQYDVKFHPEVDSVNIRYYLMKSVNHIIGETKSFDGCLLFLPIKLPEKTTTAYVKMPTDGSDVTVKINFVKQLRMGDQTTIQLYNVLFRKIMHVLGLSLQGRHFFDPKSTMQIPAHGLEVWPGYITAIQEYEDGIMLCCDSSHRVLRTQTVLELMEQLISSDSRSWRDEFIKLIVGQTVLTRYNNKIYRVDDVSFEESPRDKFEKKDGTKMSYIDYYHQHYNIKIKNISQPLLKSRVKGKIKGTEISLVNLIPELCYTSGLTDTIRADMRAMKEIAQTTRIRPSQRQFALNEFIKTVNTTSEVKNILSSWGLSLANNSIKLTGRVIPPENVYFGNDVVHHGSFNADWSRAATTSSVLSPVDLRQWAVICTNRDEKTVEAFVDMYRRCLPQLGIKMNPPQILPGQNDSIQTYMKALQSTQGRNFQIIVIVFPTCRVDKYSAVKKWCCIDNPVPSQVIQTRTIRKPEKLRSVTQKIALQVNCKLGGALWTVDIPLKCAMVIGLDTFHDSLRQGKSVGAVVASLNKSMTRWYSKVYTQSPGIELIDGLEVCILACLQKFKEINGIYPEQIIIYRDGVGDGQLKIVEQFEFPQIITACRRISPNYDPKFLFVIVQKRINTRLFTEERGDIVNPAPGTVMDHTITRKHYWDFFLVSQSVRQGTVSPTHYIVLHNTTKMSPDQVQRFSYKLTHLYYNWCGTVRVPAPCQYAHKLAALVGESIHKEASESLAEKLFFL